MSSYYIAIGIFRKQCGPLSEDAMWRLLEKGSIGPETRARLAEETGWHRVRDYFELPASPSYDWWARPFFWWAAAAAALGVLFLYAHHESLQIEKRNADWAASPQGHAEIAARETSKRAEREREDETDKKLQALERAWKAGAAWARECAPSPTLAKIGPIGSEGTDARRISTNTVRAWGYVDSYDRFGHSVRLVWAADVEEGNDGLRVIGAAVGDRVAGTYDK